MICDLTTWTEPLTVLDTRALRIRVALLGVVASMGPALCLAGPPERAPAKAGPPMQDVVSEVYPTPASVSEVTSRAQLCIARLVRFDGPDSGKSVITSVADGVIVANSRLDIRHGMMQSLVQSVLTFETHEGRFRLTHSNIKRAQRISGVGAPYNEFSPVSDGAFSERVASAMKEQFSLIAECVMSKGSDF